jgi:phosphate transport system permease protein
MAFERVSRFKGVLFRYLTFSASIVGIIALYALLVYVATDAFELGNADPRWLLTYFLTLVVPFVAFCLYSAGDRELIGQTVGALVGGVIAVPAVFVGFETLIRPIPRLTWQVVYLFLVVVPVTGIVSYAASREPIGQVGFGLLGRGLGGVGLGSYVIVLFVVFDPRFLYLYSLFVFFPIGAVFTYARTTDGTAQWGPVGPIRDRLVAGISAFDRSLGATGRSVPARAIGKLFAIMVAILDAPSPTQYTSLLTLAGGLLAANLYVVLVGTFPGKWGLFLVAIAVPVIFGTAVLVDRRAGRLAALQVGIATFVLAVGSSLAADVAGTSAANVLVLSVMAGAPAIAFIHRTLRIAELPFTPAASGETEGRPAEDRWIGLLLPVLLFGGIVVGTLLVDVLGFTAPDSWLDLAYVTGAPSRTPEDAGLFPAIVGSILAISIVAVLSFLLGVGTATYLEEYAPDKGVLGVLTRILQINIANLAAVPSIVYGLLGLGLFVNLVGFGLGTALTVGVTLSLLILPITVISSQEAIRSVPEELRRGSYAMGATRWQTTKNVVLPEALPGVLTGTILALGRAIGETAPLIMVGAATTVFNPPASIASKISAMPLQVYAWRGFPQEEFRYGVVAAGIITLLVVLIGMNATAIILRNRFDRR